MKKTLLLSLLFTVVNTFSQTYVLDETFGNNGTLLHSDVSFYPNDALLVNNQYYFVSNNNLVKLNYDGSIATNYGANGIVTLDNASHDFILLGFKYINNYFYVFGAVRNLEDGFEDGFICRLDENGNPDINFGTNGFAVANFGAQEAINDFVIDQAGNLFCTGTRFDSEIINSIRLIYFKITPQGITDTLFDVNGFKEIAVNTYSDGCYITHYDNGNFLLVGTDTFIEPENNTRQQRLLLSEIDTNGNLISSFGTNGSKLIPLSNGAAVTLKNIEIIDNSLFINYFYSWSFLTQGSGIAKYDIDTNQTIFNNNTYYNANFKIADNGLFITGSNRCADVYDSACPRDFNLSKINNEGVPDTAFNNNTDYTYNFPGENYSDDLSNTIILEDNGSILIAGHSTGIYWETFYPSGFAMLRLVPALVKTDGFKKNETLLYPNPFTDTVNITTNATVTGIEILDLTGRTIAKPSFYADNGSTRVNMQEIANKGSYILKATTTGGTFSKIIVKE